MANGSLASMLENCLFDSSEDSDVMVAEARQRRLARGGSTKQAPVPGQITVELDDLASAMLRRVWRQGNSCCEAGEDPRDLVNAAVTFYLSDETARCGQFNPEEGGALERAKATRLARKKEAI